MKTLLTENNRDYIIEETTTVLFGDDNKPNYTNQDKKIAVHKGKVSSIIFYEDEYDENGRTGKAQKVFLDAQSIKKLYDIIVNIENKRTEETYYPSFY